MCGHSSSVYHHKPHTETPATSLPPYLFPLLCSLYSDHVRPGPCHWPSKERLIAGKKRILFAFPFSVSLSFFEVFLPHCHHLLFSFISRSSPRLYFLHCRVEFGMKKNPATGFTSTNTSPALFGVDIKKARSSTKVQIRFSWIVLLWLQTCPCYPSLAQLLWAVVSVCVHVIICAFRNNSWSHEHCGCGLLVHFDGFWSTLRVSKSSWNEFQPVFHHTGTRLFTLDVSL